MQEYRSFFNVPTQKYGRKVSNTQGDRNIVYEEPVVNCDQSIEVIANCENPQETTLSQYDIEKLIVTVRGEQVLIDQDIARIYGVTTKRLNEQAKRNVARFPSSFRFELTKEEVSEVVANCDHLQSLKYRPTLPYAYTEQGIGQLSTVVHSKIAIECSQRVRPFVSAACA